MSSSRVARLTVIARGNHRTGYRGALVQHWCQPDEKTVWSCDHAHPTTKEARACAREQATT